MCCRFLDKANRTQSLLYANAAPDAMDPVKFVIPKGSLEDATFKLLNQAWARVIRKPRSYHVYLDDPDIQVKMMRPQEIPTLVADGLYDIGITGYDWVQETSARVTEMANLEYGRINLVAAFPDTLPHRSLDQMLSKYASQDRILRVSSEYLTTASSFIKGCPAYKSAYGDADPLIVTPWLRRGDNRMVQILLSFGATEAKPPDDVMQALRDEAMESGQSVNVVVRSALREHTDRRGARLRLQRLIPTLEELRERIAEEAGGVLEESAPLIREDRER